jgi:hypothetical protein
MRFPPTLALAQFHPDSRVAAGEPAAWVRP